MGTSSSRGKKNAVVSFQVEPETALQAYGKKEAGLQTTASRIEVLPPGVMTDGHDSKARDQQQARRNKLVIDFEPPRSPSALKSPSSQRPTPKRSVTLDLKEPEFDEAPARMSYWDSAKKDTSTVAERRAGRHLAIQEMTKGAMNGSLRRTALELDTQNTIHVTSSLTSSLDTNVANALTAARDVKGSNPASIKEAHKQLFTETLHHELAARQQTFRTLCLQWHKSRHEGQPSETHAIEVYNDLMRQRDWYLHSNPRDACAPTVRPPLVRRKSM